MTTYRVLHLSDSLERGQIWRDFPITVSCLHVNEYYESYIIISGNTPACLCITCPHPPLMLSPSSSSTPSLFPDPLIPCLPRSFRVTGHGPPFPPHPAPPRPPPATSPVPLATGLHVCSHRWHAPLISATCSHAANVSRWAWFTRFLEMAPFDALTVIYCNQAIYRCKALAMGLNVCSHRWNAFLISATLCHAASVSRWAWFTPFMKWLQRMLSSKFRELTQNILLSAPIKKFNVAIFGLTCFLLFQNFNFGMHFSLTRSL